MQVVLGEASIRSRGSQQTGEEAAVIAALVDGAKAGLVAFDDGDADLGDHGGVWFFSRNFQAMRLDEDP